ncbi:unnamed protein product [Peniophora sp. CBMAI 1063]|nr:unnamed protein product [Peniophora sp. CBMAI 1063]
MCALKVEVDGPRLCRPSAEYLWELSAIQSTRPLGFLFFPRRIAFRAILHFGSSPEPVAGLLDRCEDQSSRTIFMGS